MQSTPLKLRALLEDAVARGEENACQLALFENGRLVCDIAAGEATAESWFPLYSAGKGPMITAVLRLVERGVVNLDIPVCSYWQEFAENGKENITLRDILTHRAGLYSLPTGESREQGDWEFMCRLMSRRRPVSAAGSRTRYHALTLGWLLGGVCEHADGRNFEDIIREEVFVPAGIDDLRYGLSPADESRCVPLSHPPEEADNWYIRFMEDENIRRGFIPSANAFGTARGLAAHYAALMDGLLSPAMVRQATTPPERSSGDTIHSWENFGLGYILWDGGVYGHGGALGSEGFFVPEKRLAAAFTTNTLRLEHPVRDRISAELGLPCRHW